MYLTEFLKKKTVDEVGVDEMGVEEMGVDEMGVDKMGSRQSVNKPQCLRCPCGQKIVLLYLVSMWTKIVSIHFIWFFWPQWISDGLNQFLDKRISKPVVLNGNSSD